MSTYQTTYIEKPFLPHSLFVALSPLNDKPVDPSSDLAESASGKRLLERMIYHKLNCSDAEFTTIKYEKPSAHINGKPISVSFSHTPDAVCAVLSNYWVVGIDMESVQRQVSDRLAQRMKHEKETLKFYEEHPIIKIWTMKEAALKAIGTGLRKPMNSVRLEAITDNLFKVEFFNGTTAEICSLKSTESTEQWMSICYISSKLSKSFLSESYVPIHSG